MPEIRDFFVLLLFFSAQILENTPGSRPIGQRKKNHYTEPSPDIKV
jgi:hypothetical protein